jgi:hypothetical protein
MLRARLVRSLFIVASAIVWVGCEGDENKKAKNIPLEGAYATSMQEGLKVVGAPAYRAALNELMKAELGAKALYVVVGGNIGEAVTSTRDVISGKKSGTTIAANEDGIADAWLVVYLGRTSSNPRAWVLKSVEQMGNKIRVTYDTYQPQGVDVRTTDLHPYFYWVPLGDLPKGMFDVELYNSSDRSVVLTRKIVLTHSD